MGLPVHIKCFDGTLVRRFPLMFDETEDDFDLLLTKLRNNGFNLDENNLYWVDSDGDRIPLDNYDSLKEAILEKNSILIECYRKDAHLHLKKKAKKEHKKDKKDKKKARSRSSSTSSSSSSSSTSSSTSSSSSSTTTSSSSSSTSSTSSSSSCASKKARKHALKKLKHHYRGFCPMASKKMLHKMHKKHAYGHGHGLGLGKCPMRYCPAIMDYCPAMQSSSKSIHHPYLHHPHHPHHHHHQEQPHHHAQLHHDATTQHHHHTTDQHADHHAEIQRKLDYLTERLDECMKKCCRV